MHLLCFSCKGQHKYACSNHILKVSSVGKKELEEDGWRSAQVSTVLSCMHRKGLCVVIGICRHCSHMALTYPFHISSKYLSHIPFLFCKSERATADYFNPSYFPKSSAINSIPVFTEITLLSCLKNIWFLKCMLYSDI